LTTGAGPAPSTVQITAPTSSSPVNFTASATTASGGNWLTVSPASGTTPANLTVTASNTGLSAGTYTGTVTISPAGGGTATTIPVTLTVAVQAAPAITQIINAANGIAASVAPGELVSIFGTNLGPAGTAGLTLTAQGNVATAISGVTVTFNGTPAPLTYISPTQINCVVPFEVASLSAAQVVVTYNGTNSAATFVNISAAQPGIFTQTSSGSGAGEIMLPNYSLVTSSNPAHTGNTVIFYATGGGVTNPASITGGVAGSTLLRTAAPVSVTIGGLPATVSFAGAAPGLVEGILQVNAVVPAGVASGNLPVFLTVGNSTSQNGVTIAIQ
jgi:hypothetical protein